MLKVSDQGQHGFTLLEVMVALAIISISLVVLIHSQNSNVVRSYDSNCLIRAALLGQTLVSEIDNKERVVDGRIEGAEEIENVIYSWEKTITPTVIKNMKKVTLAVTWGEEGERPPFVLETYRTF